MRSQDLLQGADSSSGGLSWPLILLPLCFHKQLLPLPKQLTSKAHKGRCPHAGTYVSSC